MLMVVLLHGSLLFAATASATEPPITAVTFTPDGQEVVAISQAGLQVLSWPDLQQLRSIKASAANLHELHFSPDGQQLAIAGGNPAEEGIVELFSWPAGNSIATLNQHTDSVRSIAWLSDSMLISASLDRTIKQWSLSQTTPKCLQTFNGHSRGVSVVILLSDKTTLVSAGDDQSVRVWDLASHELIRSLNQHTKPIHSMALRPTEDGLPMIASAAGDRTIRFWQPTIGRMVRYIRLEEEPLCIAWFNKSLIAASCVDGHVRVIDVNELNVVQDLPAIEGWAYTIAQHPTDGTLVVGGNNGQVKRVILNETSPAN